MKITFVYKSGESLGIEYLSAVCRKNGHKTSLIYDPSLFYDTIIKLPRSGKFFKDHEEKIAEQVVRTQPDIIGFSVVTDDYQWAVRIASFIKNKSPDIPIIFGGIHPTSIPARVIKENCVDMVCIGEGENVIVDVLNNLKFPEQLSKIPNLWIKTKDKIIENSLRELIEPLDSLPSPDKFLFYNVMPTFRAPYTMMSSRGCMFKCTYCCNNVLRNIYKNLGKYFRRRSVDNVLAELKVAKEKYKIKTIMFDDDIFTFDEKWLGDFADKFRQEINLPFYCMGHAEFLTDTMIKSLKNAGCVHMEFGIQTVDEEIRRKVLKRFDSNEKLEESIKKTIEAGIQLKVDHIIGLPFEQENILDNSLKFYNNVRPHFIDVFWLTFYPRTEITQISRDAGLVTDEFVDKVEKGESLSYRHGGSIKSDRDDFYQFRFWAAIMPLIPKKLMSYILDSKLHKKVWTRSLGITIFIFVLLSLLNFSFHWQLRRQIRFMFERVKYFLRLRLTNYRVSC